MFIGPHDWKSRDRVGFHAALVQGLLLHFTEMLLAVLASVGGLILGHVALGYVERKREQGLLLEAWEAPRKSFLLFHRSECSYMPIWNQSLGRDGNDITFGTFWNWEWGQISHMGYMEEEEEVFCWRKSGYS